MMFMLNAVRARLSAGIGNQRTAANAKAAVRARRRAGTYQWDGLQALEPRLLLSAAAMFELVDFTLEGGLAIGSILVKADVPGGVASRPGQLIATAATSSGSSDAFESGGVQDSSLGGSIINIVAGAGLSGNADALAAFQRAADSWAALITDAVTVNIEVDIQDLGDPNIIAQAGSVFLQADYDVIYDALLADAADEGSDDSIVAALPTASQFSVTLPKGGFKYTGMLSATKANLKALGFTGLDAAFGATDATITFNSQFAFDFDDDLDSALMHFETVAIHEIGHVLGIVSAVDQVDLAKTFGYYSKRITPRVLDLFRFENDVAGADPETLAEFTAFPRFLSYGGDAVTDQIAP